MAFPHAHPKPSYWELTFNCFHSGCTMHIGYKLIIESSGKVYHKSYEDGEGKEERDWTISKEVCESILQLYYAHRNKMSERDDSREIAGFGHTDLYIKMELDQYKERKFSSNHTRLKDLEEFEMAVGKLADVHSFFNYAE